MSPECDKEEFSYDYLAREHECIEYNPKIIDDLLEEIRAFDDIFDGLLSFDELFEKEIVSLDKLFSNELDFVENLFHKESSNAST